MSAGTTRTIPLTRTIVLSLIAARRCDHYTVGTDCWAQDRIVAARYGEDQVCDPCLARAALADTTPDERPTR
jgi:hypothetical protein